MNSFLKKSYVNVTLVGIGNALNAILGFLFFTTNAKVLDLESFGKYTVLTALIISLSRIIDFGTNSVFVSKSIQFQKDIYSIKETFLKSKYILFIITIPISIIFLSYFNLLDSKILFLYFLGLLGYTINYTLFALFQKNEDYLGLVVVNFVPALIKGIAAVLIFFGIVKTNLHISYGIFNISLIFSAFLILRLKSKINSNMNIKLNLNLKQLSIDKVSLSKIKIFIKESLPAGISQMIYEGWPSLTNTFAKLFSGFSDIGIYNLASKVSQIFMLISLSAFTVLLPKNAKRNKEHKSIDYSEISIISFGMIVLSVIGVFLSKIIIPYAFGDKFIDSLQLLYILLFASCLTAIHNFLEHYFYIEQKTNYIMYINIIKVISFVIVLSLTWNYANLYILAWANFGVSVIAVLTTLMFIKSIEKQKLLSNS